jgi:ribosomal-protein-alanine N-acetyltransferase
MTATVALGPLLESDAPRCAELERILFPGDDPWSERAFREELRAGYHYVAARVDDTLVGYAGLGIAGDEAEVHTLGVDPVHQGRGIGRALLRELLHVADAAHAAVFLEVRTDNEPAHALYASEGFAVVGLRKRYYAPSGADAHTMRRDPR